METIGNRVFSLVLFAFFLAFMVFLTWIATDHVSCDPACQDRQLDILLRYVSYRRERIASQPIARNALSLQPIAQQGRLEHHVFHRHGYTSRKPSTDARRSGYL